MNGTPHKRIYQIIKCKACTKHCMVLLIKISTVLLVDRMCQYGMDKLARVQKKPVRRYFHVMFNLSPEEEYL